MVFVYLLRCADDSLYCGWTTNIERRLGAHRSGTRSRYTRSRPSVAWEAAVCAARALLMARSSAGRPVRSSSLGGGPGSRRGLVMSRSIAPPAVEATLREESGAVRLLVCGDLDRHREVTK